MGSYQLSCGHWVSRTEHMEIGAVFACQRCDTLRTTVIGWTRPQH